MDAFTSDAPAFCQPCQPSATSESPTSTLDTLIEPTISSPFMALRLDDDLRIIASLPASCVGIESLSDDDIFYILKILSASAAILPAVLSCTRIRAVHQAHTGLCVECVGCGHSCAPKLRTYLTDLAARMELLSWAMSIGCPYPHEMSTDILCTAAAVHGDVRVLRFALEAGCPVERAEGSDTDIHSYYSGTRSATIRTAAANGHNNYIVAAIESGCEWGNNPMFDAARHGKLETMKLMHDMRCPINEHVSYAAAQYAGVASDQQEKRAVLEWLAEVGAPMEKACEGVAERCLNSHNDPKRAGLQVEAFRFAASKGGALNAAATARLLLETESLDTAEFEWIRKQGCDLSGVDASSAGALWNFHAYEGGLQEIERLYASKLPWHEWALPAAIDSLDDELSVVKWMVEEGCPVSGRAMYAACCIGGKRVLPLLEFLDAQGARRQTWASFVINEETDDYPGDEHRVWAVSYCGDAAIDSGCIETFEWVIKRAPGAWLPVRAYSAAARLGHKKMLEYLVAKHPASGWQDEEDGLESFSTLGFIMQSSNGLGVKLTFEMLELCVSLGCPVSPAAFLAAARLDVFAESFQYMQWLLDKGCTLTHKICSSAADAPVQSLPRQRLVKVYHFKNKELLDELCGGDRPGGIAQWPLTKVQWLHSRGVPVGAGTMNAAAKHGNVGLLAWALEQGCKVSENSLDLAAYHGQIEAMEWLVEHDCPIGAKCTLKAAAQGRQAALCWLLERGAPFDKAKAKRALLKAQAANAPGSDERNAKLYRRATSALANETLWR